MGARGRSRRAADAGRAARARRRRDAVGEDATVRTGFNAEEQGGLPFSVPTLQDRCRCRSPGACPGRARTCRAGRRERAEQLSASSIVCWIAIAVVLRVEIAPLTLLAALAILSVVLQDQVAYPVASFCALRTHPLSSAASGRAVDRRCRTAAEQHIDTHRSPNLKQNGNVVLPTSPFFASPAALCYRASDSSMTCHSACHRSC